MVKCSRSREINVLVTSLLKDGWTLRLGKKHAVIMAPSGRRIAVPSTPSDNRSYLNFSRGVRHLAIKDGSKL